jgi:chromosomal replication initiation ATPase DnaA
MPVASGSEQLIFPFENRVAHGVEDFLVATGNRAAVGWIDRWPDWPFNTLMVVGPAGSGKTHLAALWRARSGATPIDLDNFEIEHMAAVTAGGRPILVEDCDRAVGDGQAERGLLRLYNLVRAAGGQLLLTARRPSSEWQLALPDLKSRLNSAMVAQIDAPDDALLSAIAVKLFADRQVTVGEGVISFLLNRGERTATGVARAVDALDKAGIALKRAITVPMARAVLLEEGDAERD